MRVRAAYGDNRTTRFAKVKIFLRTTQYPQERELAVYDIIRALNRLGAELGWSLGWGFARIGPAYGRAWMDIGFGLRAIWRH
jgi:hypothetical protein